MHANTLSNADNHGKGIINPSSKWPPVTNIYPHIALMQRVTIIIILHILLPNPWVLPPIGHWGSHWRFCWWHLKAPTCWNSLCRYSAAELQSTHHHQTCHSTPGKALGLPWAWLDSSHFWSSSCYTLQNNLGRMESVCYMRERKGVRAAERGHRWEKWDMEPWPALQGLQRQSRQVRKVLAMPTFRAGLWSLGSHSQICSEKGTGAAQVGWEHVECGSRAGSVSRCRAETREWRGQLAGPSCCAYFRLPEQYRSSITASGIKFPRGNLTSAVLWTG